jgi:acyl-[acyl-carrier-protein]-phospholipid O-acyltransferase/long-chain-fatty-acid--[acyl-carrier-protein] ligase
MDKALLAKRLKGIEVLLMSAATVVLLTENLHALFAVLLLLGLQAAFFGPVKYSLLPTHLADDELMLGNALIEGATFIAILMGSVLGGLLGGIPGGLSYVATGLVALSAFGLLAARLIPPAPTVDPNQSLTLNIFKDTVSLLKESREQGPIWFCILGISWFWTFGATVLALVPPIARDVLGGAESLTSLFFAIFSLGIGVGSLACARSLRGEITPAPVPWAALAMSAVLLVFAALVAVMPLPNATHQPLAEALASPGALSLTAVLFLLSATSGFYAVPLYSILQHDAPADVKARMIGANNVINSCMLVVGAIVLSLLSSVVGLSIANIAVILALANLGSIGFIVGLLPSPTARWSETSGHPPAARSRTSRS